ncbi:MAG: ArsR family transcriptional regulator [Candidatus Nanohalobium sp.]
MSSENLSYDEAEELLQELPPSAKLAYKVLEENNSEMTRDQLLDETLLEGRTLSDAVTRLEEEGIAYRRSNPMEHKEKLNGLNLEEFPDPFQY